MSTEIPPLGRDAAAARLQILATEHWSLLATRALTYNEALSRVTIFLSILSGALIALAHLGSPSALVSTPYGWVLVVKAVVVAAALVIALLLRRSGSSPLRFPPPLAGEGRVGVAVLILALAAVLISLPPPR